MVAHWVVWAHLVASAGTLGLAAYVRTLPDRPGAGHWVVALLFMAGAQACYGAGLVVFDETARMLLELATLGCIMWAGVTFLSFTLAYTGREHLIRRWPVLAIATLAVFVTLVGVTNPFHHLLWESFRMDPLAGMAAVRYEIQPFLFLVTAGVYTVVGIGSLNLVETATNYTSSSLRQAVIVALTPVVPLVAGLAWLFKLGPYPQLNLIPISFFPHLALDVYALFVRDVMELPAGLQRTGKRAAIDDLGMPVITIAADGRVIDLNAAGERLLDTDTETAYASAVSDLLDTDIDLSKGDQQFEMAVNGEIRTYKLSLSPFESEGGTHSGYTIAVQDVTTEIQRKQRLEVLNRILRHNLRNDLNVVQLRAKRLAADTSDPSNRDHAEVIRSTSERLVTLSQKARWATRALDDVAPQLVSVRPLLETVVDDVRADTNATVDIDVPESLRLEVDPELFSVVFTSIVENAITHNDSANPQVAISATESDAWVRFNVRDDGPGIPSHERAVIENGRESALQHASGIGLWLIHWGVTMLGGDVTFEVADAGSTVSVRLPKSEETADESTPTAEPV